MKENLDLINKKDITLVLTVLDFHQNFAVDFLSIVIWLYF